MTTNATAENEGGRWRRAGQVLLKVVGFFVILEPIWMLLPFAGFLYGSVLRIETLARYPATAWLTHFVCPVLSFGWTGPILVVVGSVIFLVGASQIYWAKFRRSGLVTRGLYRFVRHPQYVALTLFGVGILLTWGRAIMFIAFFAMMFLYYYLARSEERNCLRLFGEAYERYRQRTSFILPGDRLLRPLGTRVARLALPVPVRVAGAFALTMAMCFGLMWGIVALKESARTVPYLTATVSFGSPVEAAPQVALTAGEAGGIPFVQSGRMAVARGPWPNAAAPGFAERVLLRLPRSLALTSFLTFLSGPDEDVLIVFCAPYERPEQPGTPGMRAGGGSGGRGPAPDPHGPDRVRLMLLRCGLAPGAGIADAFADKSKRQVHRACIAPVNLARAEAEDMVEGKVITPGPGF
ncbi:MAG: isoprenylcysteine carboxylmethyltransferase family protein, partial [Verrucomicrobia bacterium]|nr:isoprenylcysteine carboxylmethyltransferase family protein [Verrucomicrobiota bacterium]